MPFDQQSDHQLQARVTWLCRRLRVMSAGEMALRSRDRVRFAVWRRRRAWPAPRFVNRPGKSTYRLRVAPGQDGVGALIEQAEELLAGRFVGLDQTFSLRAVRWHHDPQSGVTAPLDFGPTLDYRDPRIAGNVRNIWELNRHQYLTTVALAYAVTGDERFAAFVRRQLDSWVDQDPFPLGVNWASPLELGLRLISWVWVSRFLEGSPETEPLFGEHGRLWPSIYRHQWMIAQMHSYGSSANNHLIGEMAGLFISTVEWPLFAESRGWESLARGSLHAESARQFYDSGVDREQAFGYQLFATELLELAALEAERAGRPFADEYHDRLRRAVAAAAALAGPGALLPTYGDSDDGMAVGLPGGGAQVLERLAVVASCWLGGIHHQLSPSTGSRLAAGILLSGLDAERRLAAPAPASHPGPPGSRACVDAGLFVLASSNREGSVLCLADAGELGYLSIAAHGHADALSFVLTVGDERLLVDPGTFSYHYDPEARAYFRGTRGHNTVTVDGLDQSVAAGPFLWTRKARVTVHEWSPTCHGGVLIASHDGYERLSDPVTHRRRLVLDEGVLTIDDELAGTGIHAVEWRLHLAPECEARLGARTCDIVGKQHRLSLQLAPTLDWRLAVGSPDGGWYSGGFNQREETTTLIGSARLKLPVHLEHTLRVSR